MATRGCSGFGTFHPASYEEAEGWVMSDSIDEALSADLICLLLTDGRLHDSDFGCGLQNYLFENFEQVDYNAIRSTIVSQTNTYLGDYISIIDIDFITSVEDSSIDPHALVLSIRAQSKVTGAALPVSITLSGVGVDMSGNTSTGTTFTYNADNWIHDEPSLTDTTTPVVKLAP